jgi:hypothetical protein
MQETSFTTYSSYELGGKKKKKEIAHNSTTTSVFCLSLLVKTTDYRTFVAACVEIEESLSGFLSMSR